MLPTKFRFRSFGQMVSEEKIEMRKVVRQVTDAK